MLKAFAKTFRSVGFILSLQFLRIASNTLLAQTPPDSNELSQPDTIDFVFQELVVVANRSGQNQYYLPDAITSLHADLIGSANIRSTPELLTGQNGVWVQKTNHGGGSPYIRGLTGYHTLLLTDGIRINNSIFRSGPNQYLNTVDPFMLSAIEVLRGDGSVQYGSDALGGTVNLISYKPGFSQDKLHVNAQCVLKYVSQRLPSTGKPDAQTMLPGMENILHSKIEISGKKISMVAGYTLKQFADIQPGGKKQTLSPSAYDEYDLAYTLLYKPRQNYLFTFTMQRVRQKDIPVYHKLLASDYTRYHMNLQQRELYRFSGEKLLQGLIEKIALSAFAISGKENLEIQQSNGIHSINKDDIITKGMTFDIKTAGRNLVFNAGADIYHDHVKSKKWVTENGAEAVESRGTFANGATAWNSSFFVMGKAASATTRINAGMRLTLGSVAVSDSIFGRFQLAAPSIIWNLGLNQTITPWLNWVLSVNRGFRTPNISDLSGFGITDYRFEIPNGNLTNEKSITCETGFKSSTRYFGSSVFVYFTSLSNLITVQKTSYQGVDSVNIDGNNYIYYYTRINAQRSYITGAELDLSWHISRKIQLELVTCYTYGQNTSAREPVSRIPPINGSVALSYKVSRHLSFGAEWLFAGKQDRLSSGDKKDIRIPSGGTPSWNSANVHFHLTFNAFKISGGLNNLTNELYRTHGSGVDAYGRNLWAQLTLSI